MKRGQLSHWRHCQKPMQRKVHASESRRVTLSGCGPCLESLQQPQLFHLSPSSRPTVDFEPEVGKILETTVNQSCRRLGRALHFPPLEFWLFPKMSSYATKRSGKRTIQSRPVSLNSLAHNFFSFLNITTPAIETRTAVSGKTCFPIATEACTVQAELAIPACLTASVTGRYCHMQHCGKSERRSPNRTNRQFPC